jgi:two-component system response regulator TtrR
MMNTFRNSENFSIVRIVDDDENFLRSLQLMLSMKGWNVSSYSSAENFLAHDRMDIPGCLILDLRMPQMSGIELQQKLANIPARQLPIIFLSGHGDIDTAVHALRHGACHFLQKPAHPEKLYSVVSEAVETSLLFHKQLEENRETVQAYLTLTPREKEIFSMVAEGIPNKDISEKLAISLPTVKMHRANAFDKMQVHSSTEALLLLRRIIDYV